LGSKTVKSHLFSKSASSSGIDLLGGFGSSVASIKSEEHLFSRRLVVVNLVLGLALGIKNNTCNLSVRVVTLESDGDGVIGSGLDTWHSGPANVSLSRCICAVRVWSDSEVGSELVADLSRYVSGTFGAEGSNVSCTWVALASVRSESTGPFVGMITL